MSAPVTVMQLASHRLGREATNGADYEQAGMAMLGGCELCHASIAAYNACPSKSGYLRCANGCIGPDGWDDVEQANRDIFGGD